MFSICTLSSKCTGTNLCSPPPSGLGNPEIHHHQLWINPPKFHEFHLLNKLLKVKKQLRKTLFGNAKLFFTLRDTQPQRNLPHKPCNHPNKKHRFLLVFQWSCCFLLSEVDHFHVITFQNAVIFHGRMSIRTRANPRKKTMQSFKQHLSSRNGPFSLSISVFAMTVPWYKHQQKHTIDQYMHNLIYWVFSRGPLTKTNMSPHKGASQKRHFVFQP